MAKTILVPTDFTIRSLNILKHALHKSDGEQIDVVFFTGVVLKDSIIDLVFFSKRKILEELMTNDFKEACQIIRNKYSTQIKTMSFEIFTGFTQAAFHNFLEGNRIDEIYMSENTLHYKSECFDPSSYMQKSALPIVVVSWPEAQDSQQEDHLGQLFTSWL